MLFPDSFIDELKQRLPLSKVIASRIKLQRKGGAQYLGLCPFHQEKTPSFNVNDQKAMYYCFGCHAHGDLISFITETEKISFADAVKYLANFAGMSLPKMDEKTKKQEEKRHSLVDVLTKVTEWFAKQLRLSSNYSAYEYLLKRGVNDQDIKDYSLGFAPETGLLNFLKQEDIPTDLAVEAGLLIKNEAGSSYKNEAHERFRKRIIFPIKNQKNYEYFFTIS